MELNILGGEGYRSRRSRNKKTHTTYADIYQVDADTFALNFLLNTYTHALTSEITSAFPKLNFQ